ncbi:unnamed protein product, partial [Larinioides sclopetarius]
MCVNAFWSCCRSHSIYVEKLENSVRNHRRFESVTQHEVEMAIKKWLVYAKDRKGGRV